MEVFSQLVNVPRRIYVHYQRRIHRERCRLLLAKLYCDIDTFKISLQHRRQENINDDQFTYGEIMYESFAELLNVVQPKKNEIFYDLGCGGGKAVFTTALLYPDMIVRGVEYLPPLSQLCKRLQNSLQSMMRASKHFKHHTLNINVTCGDITKINFNDANIIYLNVTCFDNAIWSLLCEKIELLPTHARVIIISKQLTSKNFELIHRQSHLMSWGLNTVNIYRKK